MTSYNALRAIATRLTSTPVHELPHQVGYLATSVASCGEILKTPSPTSDQSVLLHKFKIRVSALLQDRTSEGRFSGIVIAKALIETGSITFLSESGSWVRNLISCLNKADSLEVKRLCIITISRIYLLTVGDQALVREITTPTLPAFISATLALIKPSTAQIDGQSIRGLGPLLDVVLRCWHLLIEHFASTIRPSVGSFKSICLSLIGDVGCSREVCFAAQEVLASLHFCAPKNNVIVEWSQICSQAIEAAHDTADLVLRAVVEEWSPAIPRTAKVTRKQKAASAPATSSSDVLGLDPWSGISRGCSTLVQHIDLLRHFSTSQHAQEIHLPIGAIFDLTSRLTAVTMPTTKFSLRTNNEITRDEREELWLNLPRIHCAVLQLFRALAQTFESVLFPVCHAIAIQFWDVFEAESDNEAIRSTSYELVASLLRSQLLPLSKPDSANFKRLVQHCCSDSLAQDRYVDDKSSLQHSATPKKQSPSKMSEISTLRDSAYGLLPMILSYVPFHKLAGYSGLRTQIDHTSILADHHEAILASVLHPARPWTDAKTGRTANPAPSLIPFLARSEGFTSDETHKLAFDALLRPRMPVVRSTNEDLSAGHDEEKEDEDEDEDEEGHGPARVVENGDTVRPGDSFDVAMANTINANPTSGKPSPSQHHLEEFASGQKRDFTTLLEQSMDAQLAASSSEMLPAVNAASQNGASNDSITKRPRLSEEPVKDYEQIVMSEDHGKDLANNRFPTPAKAETNKPFVNTSHDMLVQESAVLDRNKNKEKANHDSDDSSDSEVPPIDATLNGMSDSESDD